MSFICGQVVQVQCFRYILGFDSSDAGDLVSVGGDLLDVIIVAVARAAEGQINAVRTTEVE